MSAPVVILKQSTPGLTILQVGAGLQGPPGPPGASGAAGATLYTAVVPVSGHTAIVLDSAGSCLPADASNPAHQIVSGITLQAAIAGDPVEVVSQGLVEHLGWTFTAGQSVFLGSAGALTQTLPGDAVFAKVLGVAITPTRIAVDFQPAIFL